MSFAEDKQALSNSPMNESVLDLKIPFNLYTPRSWISLMANSVYEDLIKVENVFLNP